MQSKFGLAIGLFFIALLPRIFGLGIFITSDEPLWLTRSILFSEALLTGNLAETLQTGHPGVTTMWTSSLGLGLGYLQQKSSTTFLEFLQALPHKPDRVDITLLPWVRLPTVLLAAVCVALLYVWGSKLMGRGIALVGALLLAFDPLFLAHSRTLHHDALATIFMSLSVLALLNFSVAERFRAGCYLALSGALAGLALLSKGTSLVLVPFTMLFFLWLLVSRKGALKPVIIAGLVWLGVVAGVFVTLWPAMWVIPVQVLSEVFDWIIISADVEEVADTTSVKWDGRIPELGVLFYPINWLLRSTALSMIGLVALIGWWRAPQNQGERWVVAWLVVFGLLFTILLTIGDKRDGRYLLPIYPGLWLLAAAGLTWLASRILRLRNLRFKIGNPATITQARSKMVTKAGLMLIFAILLLTFSLPWYPYYHTYYNPIIGGSWLAPRLIKVGWGEGMEQVGAYLTQQPDAHQLVVATSYAQNLLPYFAGKSVKHHQSEPSDYVLQYIRQIQNGYPYPEYWEYYRAREPVYQLRLAGIDYLWLYQEPSLGRVRNASFNDNLELMGFTLSDRLVQPGTTVEITLVWHVTDALSPGTMAHVQLIDDEERVWGDAPPAPIFDPAGPSSVEGRYQLNVSPDAPRFDGHLRVSITDVEGRSLGQVSFGQMPVRYTSLPAPAIALPAVNLNDQISLLGYQVNATTVIPGEMMDVTLYWQAQVPIDFDYTVFVQLLNADGSIRGQHDAQPASDQLPTSQWTVGEVVTDPHRFTVARDAPSGEYRLLVGMYRWETGERLPVLNENNNESAVTLTSIAVQ